MTQVPPRMNVGESEDRQPERDDAQGQSDQTPHLAVGGDTDESRDQTQRRADDAGDVHGVLDERAPHGATAPSVESVANIKIPPPAEPALGEEAVDDSLDSILLAVGAQPLQRSANPAAESKTLTAGGDHAAENLDSDENEKTGIDEDARRLDTVAAELRAAGVEDGPDSDVDFADGGGGGDRPEAKQQANTPALIESKLTSQTPADEPQTASLLDGVAQALNVQAAEYRDRARGRLPGMPGTPSAGPGHVAEASSDAEFEDPEEGEIAALTPGIISVEEDTEALAFQSSPRNEEDTSQEVTQKVASGSVSAAEAPPPGSEASRQDLERGDSSGVGESSGVRESSVDVRSADRGDTRVDHRPTLKVPPVPGISLGATSPSVGPPPGVSRPTTPVSGLSQSSLGRMRLPTPGPGAGAAVGLPPPSGRITLPPGTTAPFQTSRVRGDLSDTMPATPFSIEASRRNTAGMPIGKGSGRVSTRGHSRVTEPVIHRAISSSFAVLLTAHVKLATVNLAGLIALTFAGGLLVGMLVWRGQGRGEQPASSHAVTTAALPSTEPKSDLKAEPKTEPKTEPKSEPKTEPKATAAGESNLAPAPTMGAAPVPAVPAAVAAGAAAAVLPAVRKDRGQMAKRAIVAPLPSPAAPATGATGLQAAAAAPVHKTPATNTARVAARPHLPTASSGGGVTTTARDTPPPAATSAPGAPPAASKTATAATATAPKAPALRTAALTASKPMATNASGKPGAKPKAKTTWKDPFAD